MGEEDTSCKIIVRNLSFDSKDEDVKAFYEKWGTVEECSVKRHKDLQKSKGFAIIKYEKSDEVEEAMGSRPHELDGRTLEPHRAAPANYVKKLEARHKCNEIFIGGWVPELEEDDLREYFGQFGTIEEIAMPKDKKDETKYRGFATIKFDDYDPVDICVYKKHHEVKEHKLDVTKYINRRKMNELKERYGGNRNNNRNNSNNFGGNDQAALLEALATTLLGGGGSMQQSGRKRGRGKPYGRRN